MPGKRLKNVVNFYLRIGISAGILWYIFSKIDIQGTMEVLKTADPRYIAYAWGVFIFIFLMLILRWFTLIRALNLAVRTVDVLRYYFFGLFGNLFLPSAIGGDMIKIYGLCKNSDQKPRVVASNKMDVPEAQAQLAKFKKRYKTVDVIEISCLSGEGIEKLKKELLKRVTKHRAQEKASLAKGS